MPELPELEVFAANLESHFKDKVLQRIEITVAKKLSNYRQDFQQHLEGHRLHNVMRDGQTLLMQFRRGRSLALHLMVQGEIELILRAERLKTVLWRYILITVKASRSTMQRNRLPLP